MPRALRRLSLFETALPQSKRLVECLKSDVIWFKHDSASCKIQNHYKNSEQFVQLRLCNNCEKVDSELKVCSRCRKAFYCDATCQKAHYPKHKVECLSQAL